jgi:hypothetical protein
MALARARVRRQNTTVFIGHSCTSRPMRDIGDVASRGRGCSRMDQIDEALPCEGAI